MRPLSLAVLSVAVIGIYLTRPAVTLAGANSAAWHREQTTAGAFAYTGTAEVSYIALPRFDLPTAAGEYAGVHRATVHFAVRDRSHFRVDVQMISPAIDSGTFTGVVNGSTALSYDARSGLAFRSMIPRQHRTALLDDLLGGLQTGAAEPGGPVPQADPGKPITSYLQLLKHPRFGPPPPFQFHARIVGHDTLLGRSVDVIDYRPITVKVIANTCTRTKSGTLCRPSRFHGSGSARIWVDHDHPFVLQYQAHGTSNVHDVAVLDGTLSYRVTSVVYGQGPSDQDLQLQPPVKVAAGWLLSYMPYGSDSGPGPGVAPPGPFVYPDPPLVGGVNVSSGIQRLGYGPHYKIGSVTILFSTGKHGTTYFYKPLRLGPFPYVKGPYLLIQEQLRVGGLPAELQTGTPQLAGKCQVWTGSYADGQTWLAFAKKRASVLISTNALTVPQLVEYVAQDMCAGSR